MQCQKLNKNVNWYVKEIIFNLHINYMAALDWIKLLHLKKYFGLCRAPVWSKPSTTVCYYLLFANRSSLLQMFSKTDVLKTLANFIGKHRCWSIILIKLQAWRRALLLKRDSTQVFSCEIWEIFKNKSTEHLLWLLLNKPRRSLWFLVTRSDGHLAQVYLSYPISF